MSQRLSLQVSRADAHEVWYGLRVAASVHTRRHRRTMRPWGRGTPAALARRAHRIITATTGQPRADGVALYELRCARAVLRFLGVEEAS